MCQVYRIVNQDEKECFEMAECHSEALRQSPLNFDWTMGIWCYSKRCFTYSGAGGWCEVFECEIVD